MQVSADGLAVGSGYSHLASDQLERYRESVTRDRSGEDLTRIVADARTKGLDVHGHDVLKTAPKGYPKDHPRIELLRFKGLIAWQEWPAGAWLGTKRAKDRIVTFLERSKPLVDWLESNVGDSTLPDRARR